MSRFRVWQLCLLLCSGIPSWAWGQAAPVVVAKVVEAEVNAGQRVVGTVQPLRTSTIGSALDGRVEQYLVHEGDLVEAGQKLAKLQTATLGIEKAAAEAELTLYKQQLAELENGSRPEEVAEAVANQRRAEAALKYADTRLERLESLAERGATSTDELEDARGRADAAKFALKAAEALCQRIKEGPRPEAIAQAQAQVELQKQRLNLIQDRMEKSTIVAPFKGFVSARFTEVGAWISQGDPVAQVIQLDEVEIQLPVTAESVVNLRRYETIRIEFPELPNELLVGKIDHIVPMAASRARTFPVHIHLKNRIEKQAPLLMAGMLARAELPAGRRETLPLVPKDALVLNGADRAIFIVDPLPSNGSDTAKGEGVARKVNVSLGVAVGEHIQVRGNVRPDDLVVTVGNERLQPDTKVAYRIAPPPGAGTAPD